MQSTKDLREYALGSANNGAYDRCSAPRSAAEAEEDLDGFARAVYRLRMEYRIPELVLGASVPVDGGTDRATTMMILGNRAHTAPAGVDWAAARDAVCTARAALEGVGDPGILGDVRRLVEEAKDLRAAQDAVAGLGTALRSGGLWCGRQRDAVNSMVHALGGEPPRDEWRWTGRAGCDWEGAENALTFAAVGADAWRAIRSRRRAEAVDRLRAALLDSGERSVHRSAVLDAIDSLTEVEEVLEQVARAAKESDADYDELERRTERMLDRLDSDDPRRGHAETLRAVMERRRMETPSLRAE